VSQADEEESLSAAEEAAVLTALEAALRPAELDPTLNERLIAMALEDPLAAATEDELAESARLRDVLEQDGSAHEDAATLAALRVAFQGPPRSTPDLEPALRQALAASEPRPRPNVVYAVFGGASALLAAAAALVLLVADPRSEAPTASSAPGVSALASDYARPRSTAPLFEGSFQTADTTARMDLIASARARDLRDNRYAAWGVR